MALATVDAPAKINLSLEILGRRDDGFHEIRSLAVGVGLRDRIVCRIAEGIDVDCADPTLCGRDNLVVRAAERLQAVCDEPRGVRVELLKRIPIGGGLGGGSSDAAAALRACNDLWNCHLSDDDLGKIGAEVGSDVPLFFSLPAADVEGRGELVTPVSLNWSGWALLVMTGVPVSTAEVYRAWRSDESTVRPPSTARICEARKAADIMSLACNDLEAPVFRVAPLVGSAYRCLQELGAGTFRVCGAGGTFYQLFDHCQEANRAAERIHDTHPNLHARVVAAPIEKCPIGNKER